MMKNRAGLLALAVLVIAIILMVFFVMPRLGPDVAKVGDAINQAGTEVNNTVNEASKTSRSAVADAAAAVQKIGSLTADADQSLAGLKALFADGKVPAADALAGAKTAAVNALTAIVDFAAPDGLDTVTAGLVSKAKDGAGKARDIIQNLPENAADALAALAKAEAALTGSPEAADTASGTGPKIPAFDVLRVEPDGSTVIAGSAEPHGKLEVLDGDKVVVTTDVDGTGDFAAVLDNPLPAGDHQLVLKVTGKDGKTTLSEEVATVSVPKDGSGSELLAMVSKPGTASRIITAPKAEVASAQPPTANDASAAPAGNQPAPNGAANDQVAVQTPDMPAGAGDNAKTAVPGTQQGGGSTADVMVNAVEIEGNKIFVAGTTRANAKVVGYADDALIGQDTAGPDGRFVIEGVMNLSVGDHKIRVDVVDGAGKVLVRATVNFNRPAGDQVTVAAQSGNTANTSQAMVPLDEGQLGKLKSDATKAFGLLKSLFADGRMPGAEQLAAARSATEFALRSLVDFRPGVDATDAIKQASASASQVASNALTVLQGMPKDAKSVGAALDQLGAIIAQLTVPNAAPMPANEISDAGQPKTIEQAPLTENNNAVIIRRGDTLWQISRRVYGLGVRYTTIYIANEDKIVNPDHIRPGQIFGLPKDALPNAEELHRKRLSGQHP